MDSDWAKKALETLVQFSTTYGIRVIGAIIILIVGRIIAGICRNLIQKGMDRAKADVSLRGFVASLVYYAVLAFAVVAALAKFGIDTASFAVVLGAAGLAIGLALQGSLSNFASGVLILIFRPFHVGDFIIAAGEKGTVMDIAIFTTTLASPDNMKVILPNSAVMSGTITNVTANATRRVDLTAGISYADDMEKAKQVIMEMLLSHPKVLKDPAPVVAVFELADSSVNLVVRPWCKKEDYWDVYFSVTQGVKEALDNAGVTIPFPQRDVHLFQAAGE
jgi:small conductance mechanosensitive channel